MKPSLRVAVAGASGIGKHHAKWYNECGCEVVAFLGSCDASCRASAEDLHQSIGFSGRGYSDLPKLLEEVEPDVVLVVYPESMGEIRPSFVRAQRIRITPEGPVPLAL